MERVSEQDMETASLRICPSVKGWEEEGCGDEELHRVQVSIQFILRQSLAEK